MGELWPKTHGLVSKTSCTWVDKDPNAILPWKAMDEDSDSVHPLQQLVEHFPLKFWGFVADITTCDLASFCKCYMVCTALTPLVNPTRLPHDYSVLSLRVQFSWQSPNESGAKTNSVKDYVCFWGEPMSFNENLLGDLEFWRVRNL